jgi:hypothetical protein
MKWCPPGRRKRGKPKLYLGGRDYRTDGRKRIDGRRME